MITFSGLGFFYVFCIYLGGFFLVNKILDFYSPDFKMQPILIFVIHVVLTLINCLLAKHLNRNEVKHTVYDVRLEKFVLSVGIVFGALILLMARAYS